MRKLVVLLFLIAVAKTTLSQELNCQVQVLSEQIQGTDKHVFETMKTAIFEFMNNRKWTTETFKLEERIDCSILINLTGRPAIDEFTGTLQIQSRRPVYKTSYNSVLLNYIDQDIEFKYTENQPLEFNENTNLSNMTSILAYYAYLVIGLDYDTFSMNGGTPYLQKCLAVVNNAQDSDQKGWKAFESSKNRYWLINNMMDATFIPLRECMYKYHRQGLDVMATNKESGRAIILETLKNLKKVHETKPLSFNMQVFFNAKVDELINIFSSAFPDEKSQITTLLNEIDPTNSNKYMKITAATN